MIGNLTGWHGLIILAILLLIFGAAKLPALAKSLGQSARLFKGEMRAMKEDPFGPGRAPSAPRPNALDHYPSSSHQPGRISQAQGARCSN